MPISDPNRYLALVRSRTVFKDGAMGTQIQDAELDDAAYGGYPGNVDHLTLSAPDVIRNIHRAYLDAGADYVDDQLVPVDPAAARGVGPGRADARAQPRRRRPGARDVRRVRDRRLAAFRRRLDRPDRACCRRATTRRCRRSRTTELVELFREQAQGLLAGGVDVLLIETMQDILETRAAITGARRAFGEAGTARADAGAGRARHHRPHAARHRHRAPSPRSCAACGPTSSALNCSVGPEHMREPVRYLCRGRATCRSS